MKIATNTIVYNGEQYIKAMIENVIDHVDEMVIQDGGSTDKTVEIIKSFNSPKIKLMTISQGQFKHLHDWGDECKYRNALKAFTDAHWILHTDVDELYSDKFLEHIREYASDKSNEFGFFFPKLNFWGNMTHYRVDGNWYPDVGGLKFFRNHPQLWWVGKIHPTVWYFDKYNKYHIINPNDKTYLVNSPIFHYGRVKMRNEKDDPMFKDWRLDSIELKECKFEHPKASRGLIFNAKKR